MGDIISLGLWIKRRRKALDLTQDELAQRVGCSLGLIQKIETDARRPSREMAARLADRLELAADERTSFIQAARREVSVARLAPPTQSVVRGAFVPAHARAVDPPAHHPSLPPTNLPTPPTPLIGRAREVAQIDALLRAPAVRLVTLTGSGGTGKTRLGLEVATALVDRFPDGVWLIELAPLVNPALVAQTIAAVVDVHEQPARPLLSSLTAFLREKHVLLVLDNCEHVIEACAHSAETLLHACPLVGILTTSREPLGIAGETSIRVPPLAVPDPHALLPLEQLVRYEAVQLFVERARAVQPSFRVTPENASAVVQVCQHLDGIPLAIELAAARVRMLTVAQIAARLHDRFRLLTGGSRTALPRQQTLQATIDWSYDLLTKDEQAVLRSLTVFAGGWTLEAAETVCAVAGTGDVLEVLTRLVDKSLVQVEPRGDAVRYRLLETICHYAREKLAASGEADALRGRHGAYFLALAEAVPEYPQTRQNVGHKWYEQLMAEQDNLRAALQWTIERSSSDIAVRLAGALGRFWYRRGDWNEGRIWLQRVLTQREGTEHSLAHAWLLFMQGGAASSQGDSTGGQAALEESLALFRELHDTYGSVVAHINLGIFAREHGDVTRATELFEERLQLASDQGDLEGIAWAQDSLGEVAVRREDAAAATTLIEMGLAYFREQEHFSGIAWSLNHLGHVAQLQGDYTRAAALHRESLPLFHYQLGVGWALESLGEVALAQDDLADATAHFTKSLDNFQDIGDPAIVWPLAGLGSVAALGVEPERAARLWGAVEALREKTGKRAAPASRATYERALAVAHAHLDENAFAAAWTAGRALSLEQAIAEALNH